MKSSDYVFSGGLVIAGFVASSVVLAQSYPVKPIRTIVTFAGVGEALCRMVAQKMTENLS